MKGLDIVLFQKEDLPDFKSYISRAFHPKYILSDEKYIDWQYELGGLYVAKANGKIVGHFGYVDLPYVMDNNTTKFRVLMNLYVEEQYRLSGLGAVISQKVIGEADRIFVSGFTAGTNLLCAHFKKTFKDAGNLSRFIYLFRPEHPINAEFAVDWKNSERRFLLNNSVSNIDGFNPRFNEFWNSQRDKYKFTAERTFDYLEWRFKKHPFFEYQILSASDNGKLSGYLVWRMEVSDEGFRMARIIDMISEENTCGDLIEAFLHYAQKENAHAADFMFSGNRYDKVLSDAGFINTINTKFATFPIYFCPISRKKFNINIGYNTDVSLSDAYITKADGDQDRPNPH